MREKGMFDPLSIQAHPLNIFIVLRYIFRDDGQSPWPAAGLVMQGQPWELRCPDGIDPRGRRYRIEAHHAKDIPGRHLAAIFVAVDAQGLVTEILRRMFPDQLLRLPGLPAVIIEIGIMMTRLVVVMIMMPFKILIQLSREFFFTAH